MTKHDIRHLKARKALGTAALQKKRPRSPMNEHHPSPGLPWAVRDVGTDKPRAEWNEEKEEGAQQLGEQQLST